MGLNWTKLVWTLDLHPTQMLVAQAMADFANGETGEAWPSQQTVATKTGLSKRTVGERMGDLEALEVLIKVSESKQHKPPVYRFNPDPPVARTAGPGSQELPPSGSQSAPSGSQPAPSGSQTTASRVAGDATKPSRTISEPSSTDWEEARRITETRAAGGKKFTNRLAYEAKVAENLAEERRQREQSEKAATRIAECERCDVRGFYYEETPGSVTDTSYRCAHGDP